MRKFSMIPIMIFMLLFTACSDSSLQKASKTMLVVATAVEELQKNTQLAEDQNLIDKATADKIFDVCSRVNVAGKQVDAILRSITQLTPDSRKSIIALLGPISASLDPSAIEFIGGIKDAKTKQEIEGGLILVRSSISSIQLIVASGG